MSQAFTNAMQNLGRGLARVGAMASAHKSLHRTWCNGRINMEIIQHLDAKIRYYCDMSFQLHHESIVNPAPNSAEISLYRLNPIAAVKAYRNRTGQGLHESKHALDATLDAARTKLAE